MELKHFLEKYSQLLEDDKRIFLAYLFGCLKAKSSLELLEEGFTHVKEMQKNNPLTAISEHLR